MVSYEENYRDRNKYPRIYADSAFSVAGNFARLLYAFMKWSLETSDWRALQYSVGCTERQPTWQASWVLLQQ